MTTRAALVLLVALAAALILAALGGCESLKQDLCELAERQCRTELPSPR